MKALEISLLKATNQSVIFYHEKNPFSRWHYHAEFELVLIVKGSGKRMVGDGIDRFEEGDLVFLGSNLPHEWLCDDYFYNSNMEFLGEGIVIHFLENFLGDNFFQLPENKRLRKILDDSSRGCLIEGKSKGLITKIMKEMIEMESDDRLYALFQIFNILSKTTDFSLLSSPSFSSSFQAENTRGLRKVIEFTMQNFQNKIQMKEILSIANMSNTTFSVFFKKHYHSSFSEYLLKVRIGYACNLLTDSNRSIAQISYDAGFENISNFNRQFKKGKGITPKEFRKKAEESEKYEKFYVPLSPSFSE